MWYTYTWYVTVLSMKRQNVERFMPGIIAILYVVSGDYVSLLRQLRILF